MKHFYLIIFFVISAFTHVNAEIETTTTRGLLVSPAYWGE
jgi:hypothetical protein